jgi:hypothetical protein
MSNNDRIVYRREDGLWANQRIGAERPADLHSTQRSAVNSARTMIQNAGGGELTTSGVNGRFRSKDTIYPGNDPCPPKDKEH